jgi:hypothetical protein
MSNPYNTGKFTNEDGSVVRYVLRAGYDCFFVFTDMGEGSITTTYHQDPVLWKRPPSDLIDYFGWDTNISVEPSDEDQQFISSTLKMVSRKFWASPALYTRTGIAYDAPRGERA